MRAVRVGIFRRSRSTVKRIEGDFCALLHHDWTPRIAPTTAVLDLL